jgi:multidrug efflux pump subunit AcrB
MTVSDLSIKNPVFAVMLSAAMIVFGYLGYRDMGVSQFPEVDFPVVSIVITREAASPDIMDGDVTDVVEDAVAGVEGVNYIMSQSLEGVSIVNVYFHLSRNIDVAMQDIQNAVSGARRLLPQDIDPPIISKVNPNLLPVMWLTLSGPVPLRTISDFAEKEFKQQIAAIPEVGGVQFGGLQARNIRIWIDRDKLASYNLAATDVLDALQKQHAEQPAGYIQSDRVEFNLRTMGEAYSLEEFNRLLVVQRNGQQIYLGDVATVEDGLEDRRSFARFNRMPAVAVGVRKAIGGNLVAVCENVKKALGTEAEPGPLRKMLPPGVQVHVPVDYSLFVRENIDELNLTLFLGIVLTAAVCFLFLGSLGTTINICLSIPTSLIGTFFVIKMLGFTINLMTLLGLSLSVGVVVDDAILVLENIYRHREHGRERRQAALLGAREIAFAAIAATLSIMAIFLPVAFMTGTIGKFFFQFGVTVGVAVFLSLASALTLTPMLCAFFLNLHQRVPRRPIPFGLPLSVVAGLGLVLVGSVARLVGMGLPVVGEWAWPIWDLASWVMSLVGMENPLPAAAQAGGTDLAILWGIETLSEFAVGALLVRYGNVLYWAVDRFLLEPLLIRPTEWTLEKMTTGYAWLLRVSLICWPAVVGLGVVLIGAAFAMIYWDVLGRELVPSEDQSRFVVHIVCPVGSSIDHVDELLQECEAKLVHRDDVKSILTTVATEPGQLMNEADIFVQLVPQDQREMKQQEIIHEVRSQLAQIEDIRVIVRDQSTEGFTAQRGDPVDFALQGNWDQLRHYAGRIRRRMHEARLEHVPDGPDRDPFVFKDIDTDLREGMAEVQITPNRKKMDLLRVPVDRLANTTQLLVGGLRVGKFTDRGRRYDVRVRLKLPQRASPDDLKPLAVRAGDSSLVSLLDVTEFDIKSTMPVINRYNHQRKIEITANPGREVSQGEAIARSQEIINEELPPGEFTVVELGNAQAMHETIRSLIFALGMGVIIAYMILGVQFNSFVHPFTVLLAMPFAVTGALFTLWLTGDTLNMMSMIGLILLMGLVKKNSIILVDHTNKLREEGMGVRQAVLTACPVRLRPILMTSVATVAGAIPAAIGLGPGAETRSPMARGIIGGIVLSTLVTLILVPVFYVLIERLRGAAGKLLPEGGRPEEGEKQGRDVPPAAEPAGMPATGIKVAAE